MLKLLIFIYTGSHWSSDIIGMLLNGSEQLSPSMKENSFFEAVSDIDTMTDLTDPRLLHCHLPIRFLPEKHLKNKKKLIHVIRNPKDVLVSWFHHIQGDKLCGPKGIWDVF